MSVATRHALRNTARTVSTTRSFASASKSTYGRTAAYRRIHNQQAQGRAVHDYLIPFTPTVTASRSIIQSPLTHHLPYLQSRTFTSSLFRLEGQRPREEDIRDPPSDQSEAGAKSSGKASEQGSKASEDSKSSGEKEESGDGQEDASSSKEKKEEPSPPPPHGDKTPFQVFVETMKSEFKASKEWNESTKAISDGTNSFFNSEAVRKAQQASEAASSKTSQAIKGTGKVLGQGAAWTWETPVVKGVRSGVSATGRGMEKVTRPVRETKAYKAAMDVIDDGSSSRYGGWVEKEERRKRRELREAQEGGLGAQAAEKMEEDPK